MKNKEQMIFDAARTIGKLEAIYGVDLPDDELITQIGNLYESMIAEKGDALTTEGFSVIVEEYIIANYLCSKPRKNMTVNDNTVIAQSCIGCKYELCKGCPAQSPQCVSACPCITCNADGSTLKNYTSKQ